MTNHPNRNMTPARRAFLEAALANGNKIIRPVRSCGWCVGELRIREKVGENLLQCGWIAAVKENGVAGGNTVRSGSGYLYAVTEAGRAALAVLKPPIRCEMCRGSVKKSRKEHRQDLALRPNRECESPDRSQP